MIDWKERLDAFLDRTDRAMGNWLHKAFASIVFLVLVIAVIVLIIGAVLYVGWVSEPPGPCDFWRAPVGRKAC
jgi:hypothetical protein